MENVKNQFHCLKVLADCDKKLFNTIVEHSNKKLVFCLCECILNCLNGNVNIDSKLKEKLNKHKHVLRQLVNKRQSIKNKKQLIIQHGRGIFPLILPAILTAVSAFLNK